MRQVSLRVVFLMCVLLGALSFQAYAQEATIVGTVTDPTGAAVPNANITLTNNDTNQVRQIATSSVGQYLASGLQLGHYTIRVEAAGFKKAERTDLVLAVGDRRAVDFKLEIGNVTESVTVEATPVAVQSESGEVSDVISSRQVENIAVNGRSIYGLAALTAGASSDMPDLTTPTAVGGNASISFNGLRMGHNIYLLDGGEDLDRGGSGTMSISPSIDSISEFRVLASNYGADYGLSSAATFTMVLKSGTKDFHASGWEFLRNEDLDANRFFNNRSGTPRGLDRYNIYGFNVGGPVYIPKVYNKNKDKTFFFYNMEWRKIVSGGALNQNVPLQEEYTGNLSSLLNLATPIKVHVPYACAISQGIQNSIIAAGYTPSPCVNGSPDTAHPNYFTNNQIPAGLINNATKGLLAAGIFPKNTTVANGLGYFTGGNNGGPKVREEIFRIDHHFGDKFWLFGHWVDESINQIYGTTMWSGDNVPSAYNTFGNPSYSGVIHATYTISPTLLNEAAFNYNGNRINILAGPNAVTTSGARSSVGRVFTGENKLSRLPSIALGGELNTNYTLNWVPWVNKADDYQIRDDISWTKGSHQLKFGASWAIYKKAQTYFANTQGGFTFDGTYSGSGMADFLLGLGGSYGEQGYQGLGHWDNVSWAAYVQDNWKVSSRLTLNLGLRWDGIPHTYDENSYSANFYPNLYSTSKFPIFTSSGNISPSSPGLGTSPIPALQGFQFYLNGVGLAGQNGIPKGLVKNYWANFGPRVGFAYDVTGGGKTVVRGGFGMMYERIQGNDMYNGATNPPFGGGVNFSGITLTSPLAFVQSGAQITPAAAPITVNGITGIYLNDYKPSLSTQYSVGVQQELAKNVLLGVTYVGNQQRHQNSYTEINLPDPSLLAGIAQGTVNPTNVVPYLGFSSIRLAGNNLNGHYNGLQVELHSQINRDLNLNVSYTYSKAIDPVTAGNSGGDLGNVSNPYNRAYDNGPSALDRRNMLLVNFVYDLPILRGDSGTRALRAVVGGWSISGVITEESGLPLNITEGGTYSANGLNKFGASGTNRPNFSGKVSYPKSLTTGWFATSGFSDPAPGQWGNFPKNSMYGPGRNNFNLSLFKDFTFSESRGSKLQIRLETFNTFNHTQWNGISASFGSGDFGKITNTYDPRNVQLGVKLLF